MRILKSGVKIEQGEISEVFQDEELLSCLRAYYTWKLIGFPRACWADTSSKLVQVVCALKPLDDFYHPPIRL